MSQIPRQCCCQCLASNNIQNGGANLRDILALGCTCTYRTPEQAVAHRVEWVTWVTAQCRLRSPMTHVCLLEHIIYDTFMIVDEQVGQFWIDGHHLLMCEAVRKGRVKLNDNHEGKAACWKKLQLV